MKVYKPGTDCEVELSIFANERPCQEYVLPNSDDEPNASFCYIPVTEDARITVHGTFSGSVLYGHIDVLADGTFVADRRIEDHCSKEGILKCWENRRVDVKTFLQVPDENDRKPRLRPKVAEGNLVAKRIPHKELTDGLHGGDDATGIGVGSIALVVSLNQEVFDTRGGDGHPHYPSVTLGSWRDRVADVADSSIEPELEMNMEIFPDSRPVKDKRATHFWRNLRAPRPGSEPWAYFIFYYRTQAAIDAAGGVPLLEPKALPADGGLFTRACDQEMVSAPTVTKSPSPPPAPEVKKKMGLGQALLLPGSQPTRDTAPQRSSFVSPPQQQRPGVKGTPDSLPLSWTPPPTTQEVQETASCLMAALTEEQKTRLRTDAIRDMSEQQRQQATAMNEDPLMQYMIQQARQMIIDRGISAGQQQQDMQFVDLYGTNMSSSVESEKDSLFGSADETKVKEESDENANDGANFDLAPPLEHPLFSSKHADNTSVFQTPKNRVTFSDPLTIGSAKELGSAIYSGIANNQDNDLASPSSPLFEPQTPISKSSLASSTSPMAKPSSPVKSSIHLPHFKRPISQLSPTSAVPTSASTSASPPPAKRSMSQPIPTDTVPASVSTSASPPPAKRPISHLHPTGASSASASTSMSPTPAKRPISQLTPTDSAPASTATSMSPPPAKRLRNEEMQQRKARLEAEIKAKRERKAAIKKANEEEAARRQRQEQLWAEEDAKRRAEEEKRHAEEVKRLAEEEKRRAEEEERRRIAEEEEEARRADEALAAEMEALERENDMEEDDVEREIEEGQRQRAEWEEKLRARGVSEVD